MTWPVIMVMAIPAFAAAQNGPFLVTDRVDSYAIAGEGFASRQNAVLGIGYGATQSNGVVGLTNATMSYGVQGIANASNGSPSFGVIGSSVNGNGIYGYSLSPTWAGIYATNRAANGSALQAAADGTATFSSSAHADGVVGQTHANTPPTGVPPYAGIRGIDVSSIGTSAGVIGSSPNGAGVIGNSPAATGVIGETTGGIGVEGIVSFNGVGVGILGEGPVGVQSVGQLIADTGGTTAGSFYEAGKGCATCQEPAALLVSQEQTTLSTSPTPVIQAAVSNFEGYPSNVLTLYQSGDLYIAGKIVEGQGSLAAIRTRRGGTLGMYASRTSEQTVEDVGEARLTNGEAIVKLDPAFSETLDATKPYVVFVTPEANSKQLFVSDRNLNSFGVHESEAGRSSISFAYRIVGHAIAAKNAGRLPDLKADREYVGSRARGARIARKPITTRAATQLSVPPEPKSTTILPVSPVLH